MTNARRRTAVVFLALSVAVILLTAPALAHEGHESHDRQQGSGLSIWPFFLVFGTVTAGGSLLAGYVLDVPRQHAVGLAAGGAVVAAFAGVLAFL